LPEAAFVYVLELEAIVVVVKYGSEVFISGNITESIEEQRRLSINVYSV